MAVYNPPCNGRFQGQMKFHKRHYQVTGFSGAVCFLFGAAYMLVKREFSLYVLINMLLGAAMGGFYLYSNVKEVSKLFVSSGRRGAKNIAITAFVFKPI